MVVSDGKLHALNISKQYLEAYKDETPVNKWPINPPADNIDSCDILQGHISIQTFPEGVLVSRSVTLLNGYRMDFFKIYRDGMDYLPVRTIYSQITTFGHHNPISRFLYRNRILCIYRDSLWFVDRRDKHLMELPFEFSDAKDIVNLREPIKHFKISYYSMGCGFEHKLIYVTERSSNIYQLDLSQLPPLANYKIKNNRVLYTQPTVLSPSVLLDRSGTITESLISSVHSSEGDKIVTVDFHRLVQVHQPLNHQPPAKRVSLCNKQEPQPDYSTRNSRFREKTAVLYEWFLWLVSGSSLLLKLMCWAKTSSRSRDSSLFAFLLLLVCYVCVQSYDLEKLVGGFNPYKKVSDLIARQCVVSKPQSFGFKHLHLSWCHESAHKEPTRACVFANWTTPEGENVNLIVGHAKCYYQPGELPLSNGLKTMYLERSGGDDTFYPVTFKDESEKLKFCKV